MPADLGVHFEQARFHGRGAYEPRAARVIDQRRVAAPAEGILGSVRQRLEPATLVLQRLDDQAVGFLFCHVVSLYLRSAPGLTGAGGGGSAVECATGLLL